MKHIAMVPKESKIVTLAEETTKWREQDCMNLYIEKSLLVHTLTAIKIGWWRSAP